jgi:hypothetical protein
VICVTHTSDSKHSLHLNFCIFSDDESKTARDRIEQAIESEGYGVIS